MKSHFITLFAIILYLSLPALITAQTHRASLRGTIYDAKHAAIPGVEIRLTSVATGEVRETNSRDQGEYAISSLPAGLYELHIHAAGFEQQSHMLELLVNEERRYDITLIPGLVELVTVDATSDTPLKKDNASLGTVIDNRQVTGLPLDGRNF